MSEAITKGLRSMWWTLLIMWTITLAKIVFKDQFGIMGLVSLVFIWKNVWMIKIGVPQ